MGWRARMNWSPALSQSSGVRVRGAARLIGSTLLLLGKAASLASLLSCFGIPIMTAGLWRTKRVSLFFRQGLWQGWRVGRGLGSSGVRLWEAVMDLFWKKRWDVFLDGFARLDGKARRQRSNGGLGICFGGV